MRESVARVQFDGDPRKPTAGRLVQEMPDDKMKQRFPRAVINRKADTGF